MYDVIVDGARDVIDSIIGGSSDVITRLLEQTIDFGLYPERFMDNFIDGAISLVTNDYGQWVRTIYGGLLGIGLALILLKFLKKGLDVYIVGADGDPDSDPIGLVVNMARAVAIAVSFPLLYDLLATAIKEINTVVLDAIEFSVFDIFSGILSFLSPGGAAIAVILTAIYAIALVVLLVQYLMRGLEILVLRVGMPLASVGLIDSDKGVFGPYMRRFFMLAATLICQCGLMKLSMVLFIRAHQIWGIASILLAIRTPRFLQEFMLAYGFGNPMTGIHFVQTLRGFVSHSGSNPATQAGAAATATPVPAALPPTPPPVV